MNIDIKLAQKLISIIRKYIEFRNNKRNLRKEQKWNNKFKENLKIVHKLEDKLFVYLHRKSVLSKLIFDGFEEIEIEFVKKFLKPGDTFIDIGANLGLFSLIAAKIIGNNGRVHSFEPTPETYSWLQENITLNNFGHIVELNNIGLSEFKGNLTLNISNSGHDAWNTFADDSNIKFHSKIDIDVDTLDNYIENNSINYENVSLIKIDVEGWELKVFRGATKLLANFNAPILLVEFTESNLFAAGTNCYELFDFIVSFGYRWYTYDLENNVLIPEIKKLHYPYNNLIAIKDIEYVKSRIKQF